MYCDPSFMENMSRSPPLARSPPVAAASQSPPPTRSQSPPKQAANTQKKYRRSACVTYKSQGSMPQLEVKGKDGTPLYGEKEEKVEEMDPEVRARMRKGVVMEILTSEESYLTGLMLAREVYIKTLEEKSTGARPLLSPPELQLIAGNFPILINYSKALYNQLASAIKNDDSSELSNAFSSFIGYSQIYKEYTKNYSAASNLLTELCKKRSHLNNFLTEAHMSPSSKGLSFQDYLIMPVQRIPRYVLLLKEVCKYTPQSHKDFLCVQNAYTQVEDLAKEVNEGKRRAEKQEYLLNIQQQLGGCQWLLAPHRCFVAEEEIWDLEIGTGTCNPITAILFNDFLLIVRKTVAGGSGTCLQFLRAHVLTDVQILPLPWVKERKKTEKNEKKKGKRVSELTRAVSSGSFKGVTKKGAPLRTSKRINREKDYAFQLKLKNEPPVFLVFKNEEEMEKWQGFFRDSFQFCQAMTKENINADVKYTIGSFDFEKSDYSFQIQHPIHGVQRHAEKFSKDAQCNFFYGSDAIKWFEKKEKKGMTTEDALDQLESMKNCGLFSSNSKKFLEQEKFKKKQLYKFSMHQTEHALQILIDVQRSLESQPIVSFSFASFSKSRVADLGKKLLERIERETKKLFGGNRLSISISCVDCAEEFKYFLVEKRNALSESNRGAIYHQADHIFWANIDGLDVYLGDYLSTILILRGTIFVPSSISSLVKEEWNKLKQKKSQGSRPPHRKGKSRPKSMIGGIAGGGGEGKKKGIEISDDDLSLANDDFGPRPITSSNSFSSIPSLTALSHSFSSSSSFFSSTSSSTVPSSVSSSSSTNNITTITRSSSLLKSPLPSANPSPHLSSSSSFSTLPSSPPIQVLNNSSNKITNLSPLPPSPLLPTPPGTIPNSPPLLSSPPPNSPFRSPSPPPTPPPSIRSPPPSLHSSLSTSALPLLPSSPPPKILDSSSNPPPLPPPTTRSRSPSSPALPSTPPPTATTTDDPPPLPPITAREEN